HAARAAAGPAPRHNQAAIQGPRECSDSALNLIGTAQVDRPHLHPQRWGRGLDRAELTRPGRYGRILKERRSLYAGRDPSHFAPMPYSYSIKPVALPPGRASVSTKPAPTGSATCTNTIGTVRTACCNTATAGLPTARVTSGASATNSAAYLRLRSASIAPQR